MDVKRFPAPGNEAGYRDAAQPAPEIPSNVVPPAAPAPVRSHVVAVRPDDPELARQHAFVEGTAGPLEARIAAREAEAARRRDARVGLVILVVVLVLSYIVAMSHPHRPLRNATPPVSAPR